MAGGTLSLAVRGCAPCRVSLSGVRLQTEKSGDDLITATVGDTVAGGIQSLVVANDAGASAGVTVAVGPTLVEATPASAAAGGTVVLRGANFPPDARIIFDGAALRPDTISPVSATTRVPPEALGGKIKIHLTGSGGPSNALPLGLKPTLTRLAPDAAASGRVVTIHGANLSPRATLFIGTAPATLLDLGATGGHFRVDDVIAPGKHDVRLTLDGFEASLPLTVAPGIRTVEPHRAAGGATVTLRGGFGPAPGTLRLAGTPVATASWTATEIKFVVPPATPAGPASLEVEAAGMRSAPAAFAVIPGITSVTPAKGPPGTPVTITGQGFGATQGGATVSIGGLPMMVTAWSATSIVAEVPGAASPGAQPIVVTVGGSRSQPFAFEHERPWIDTVTPGWGTPGTSVTLRGRYFGATTGTVSLGGSQAVVMTWSPLAVTIVVLAGPAGKQGLRLHAAAASSNLFPFYRHAPSAWIPFTGPRQRWSPSVVYTSTELIVWGGYSNGESTNSGERYNPATDSWSSMTNLGAPEARSDHSAVWMGDRMLIWGGFGNGYGNSPSSYGVYDPASDTWLAGMGPSGGFTPYTEWTGRRAIGFVANADTFASNPQAVLYAPVTNEWTVFNAPADAPASQAAVIWCGARLNLWGGTRTTYSLPGTRGYTFDPDAGSWRMITTYGAPAQRLNPAAACYDERALFWGGGAGGTAYPDGGQYEPVTDRWFAFAPEGASPPADAVKRIVAVPGGLIFFSHKIYLTPDEYDARRWDAATNRWEAFGATLDTTYERAFCTGESVLIWNASQAKGRRVTLAGAATPVTGSAWLSGSKADGAWTGSEYLVWDAATRAGTIYSPATDTWRAVSSQGAPSAREDHVTGFVYGRFVVWGGRYFWYNMVTDAAQYDVSTDAWLPVATAGAPSPRRWARAVSTGDRLFIWGGADGAYAKLQSGGLYDPLAGTWTATSTVNAPAGRSDMSLVWTGNVAVVWGGSSAAGAVNTGGRYDPALDVWTATAVTAATPSARLYHAAAWSGGIMTVWGGQGATWEMSSGGRYDPVADTWQPTSISAQTPAPARQPKAVAMGGEVFVWGGQGGARYNPATDVWAAVAGDGTTDRYFTVGWTGSEIIVYPRGRYVP